MHAAAKNSKQNGVSHGCVVVVDLYDAVAGATTTTTTVCWSLIRIRLLPNRAQ